ncbi:predicted protein [Plenodomus lingam JN3]|uniref:Predicted protein n=1 Tax=Leptosphaeria maculans (strain JN3 / isolate v23.1.3 / race Av1-4-5-6-7-8) TaxID=985895 RepID=E5A9U5_LEPMJ|nr:predicted protein [Plenodomus lingam JN3]CBY00436.1 predicted protein [Plenodomus lingam JN3]
MYIKPSVIPQGWQKAWEEQIYWSVRLDNQKPTYYKKRDNWEAWEADKTISRAT